MMVYCRIISRNGKISAQYSFGGTESDMTGKITFFSGDKEPVIDLDPQKEKVSKLWIGKLIHKYYSTISKGEFKDIMAYEC